MGYTAAWLMCMIQHTHRVGRTMQDLLGMVGSSPDDDDD